MNINHLISVIFDISNRSVDKHFLQMSNLSVSGVGSPAGLSLLKV